MRLNISQRRPADEPAERLSSSSTVALFPARSNWKMRALWTCPGCHLVYLAAIMIGTDFRKMGGHIFPLLARTSGFVTSGQGLATSEEGVVMFLLWGLLGAFCGLVCGLMASQLARYVGFLLGRKLGGLSWSIGGALLGAAIFAWLATTDKED